MKRRVAENSLTGFGIAVLAVMVAAMGWVLLSMVGQSKPTAVFFPAVFVAIFFGGVGPGFLAAVLSAATAFGLLSASSTGITLADGVHLGVAALGFLLASVMAQAKEEKSTGHISTLNAAMAAAIEGVVRLHPSGRIMEANQIFADFTGRPVETLEDFPVLELVALDDRDQMAKAAKQCWSEGKAEADVRLLWRGAAPHDAHFTFIRSGGAKGQPPNIFCFVKDISKRKKVQEELRRTKERLEVAFRHGLVGMTVSDWDGRFVEVNPAFCEMIGFKEEDLLGRDTSSVMHRDDMADTNLMLNKLREGVVDHCVIEKRFISRSGQTIYVRVSIEAGHDEHDRPAYFVSQVQELSREEPEREIP